MLQLLYTLSAILFEKNHFNKPKQLTSDFDYWNVTAPILKYKFFSS
jgi:hypothetical protein